MENKPEYLKTLEHWKMQVKRYNWSIHRVHCYVILMDGLGGLQAMMDCTATFYWPARWTRSSRKWTPMINPSLSSVYRALDPRIKNVTLLTESELHEMNYNGGTNYDNRN